VEQANALWRDQWVGIIDVKKTDGVVVGELSVIPENGPAYIAGYIDEMGEPTNPSLVDLENHEETKKFDWKPNTVEDLRDWVRAGCPVD